jgi:hypothetical protein
MLAPMIAGVRIPDADTMWALYRHTSDRALAAMLDVDHSGLSRHLRRAGFVRGPRSWRLRTAPCRECGERFGVADATRYRLCAECEAIPTVDRGPCGAMNSLPDEPPAPLPAWLRN